ncbi:MAG TPA: hypothetical protein VIV15_14905, partial [Anaerolineales bacterium]
MHDGIRLRILGAVTLPIQPELFISDDLTEDFQVFHGLLRAKVWQKIRVGQLIDAIRSKGTCIMF